MSENENVEKTEEEQKEEAIQGLKDAIEALKAGAQAEKDNNINPNKAFHQKLP
ncbi:MAG: hypothetical protein PSN44_02570 [Gammaproteobacteria bacterium]|nr:hypothetical protein [Gammaproteobacteria bacterium]